MAVSRSDGRRRRSAVLTAIALAAAIVLAGPLISPAPAIADDIFDGASQGLEDVDARAGNVLPTAAQRSAVSALGATARWNRFGTPQSLIKYGGFLATGLSRDPEAAARAFLNRNRGIFRLTTAQISALELVSEQRMAQSNGHGRAPPAAVRRPAGGRRRDGHRRRRRRPGGLRLLLDRAHHGDPARRRR